MSTRGEQALAIYAIAQAADAGLCERGAIRPLADHLATSACGELDWAAKFLVRGAHRWPDCQGAVAPALDSIPATQRAVAMLTHTPEMIFNVPSVGVDVANARRLARELSTAMTSLLSASDENQLLTAMPWIGWAARRTAAASRDEFLLRVKWSEQLDGPNDAVEPLTKPSDEFPAAVRFRELRTQVWRHQAALANATPDTYDMLGGITFTKGLAEGRGSPYPTWQCARPLAFIATMLGDPRLTEPQERPAELVKLLSALRYLRQLQVDDASAWLYAEPSKAMGGIRVSVWDSSLPLDSSSMTLLCIVETLKSLDALTSPAGPPEHVPSPKNP